MISHQRIAIALIGIVGMLAVTTSTEAQLGGLVKKGMDAVKAKDKLPEAKTEAAATGSRVTPEILAGFDRALTKEIALRKGFTAELAKLPTKQQRNKCEGEWAQSPEGSKLMMEGPKLPDNATAEQAQAAILKHSQDMETSIREKCPLDVETVWPNGKRQARLLDIENTAAAELGSARATRPPDEPELEDGSETDGIESEWSAQSQPDPDFYRFLKEWIPTLCNALAAGTVNADGKPVRIPGAGANIFWVYSADEVKFITPHCTGIMKLLGAL